MARKSLIIIDEFYDNPDEIRRDALSLQFHRPKHATYPGSEAVSHGKWHDVWCQLRSNIDEDVDAACPKPVPTPQGLFRLALAEDEFTRLDGIHQDAQRWSGVIYLSRPQDCRGGVAFFRHRDSGLVSSTRELEYQLFAHLAGRPADESRGEVLKYLRDMDHWEEIARVDMRYNRAVLLMAQCFHMSMGIFGDTPENGRLTQHFEFYSKEDKSVYETEEILA